MNEVTTYQPMLPTLGEFDATSWTPPPNMTYNEWEQIGQTFQFMQGAINWWVGDWLNEGEKRYGESYTQAVQEATGKSYQTLANCKWVAEKFEVSRRRENVHHSLHIDVASLDPELADELLEWAEDNKATQSEFRAEIRRRKLADKYNVPPIEGKYRIFYADPPWSYNDSGVINTSDNYGRAQRHYDTMTMADLCDMGPDIQAASDDDSVLFMWVTSPLLEESFEVVTAWGFEYKTSFVWDKVGHNFGHYNSVRHELLLICTKGSCTPDNNKLYDSVISIEKTRKHSEKPEEFRAIIDDLYSYGNRLELFARTAASGWDSWGDQV